MNRTFYVRFRKGKIVPRYDKPRYETGYRLFVLSSVREVKRRLKSAGGFKSCKCAAKGIVEVIHTVYRRGFPFKKELAGLEVYNYLSEAIKAQKL